MVALGFRGAFMLETVPRILRPDNTKLRRTCVEPAKSFGRARQGWITSGARERLRPRRRPADRRRVVRARRARPGVRVGIHAPVDTDSPARRRRGGAR